MVQGHPAVYETVPAGVYRLSLNYPCYLKSQLWTINSHFNYVYNVTLDSNIQFELPYNSYMSPLLEMNLTHEEVILQCLKMKRRLIYNLLA